LLSNTGSGSLRVRGVYLFIFVTYNEGNDKYNAPKVLKQFSIIANIARLSGEINSRKEETYEYNRSQKHNLQFTGTSECCREFT
jgi:hypothetical protein